MYCFTSYSLLGCCVLPRVGRQVCDFWTYDVGIIDLFVVLHVSIVRHDSRTKHGNDGAP